MTHRIDRDTTAQPAATGWRTWLPEAALVTAIVLVALLPRLYRAVDFPIGLHYDEAIDIVAGLRIARGDFFLFLAQGWGREPLYYYLLGPLLAIVPDHVLAFRLTGALCSAAIMLLAYLFMRRRHDRLTALLTIGWLAVTFWAVFLSRAANRGILLPLPLIAAAHSFWLAFDAPPTAPRRRLYALAGVWLGLALYVYQPARFAPFIYLAFAGYLWLCHRPRWRSEWRALWPFVAAFALTALPLALYLALNPTLEGDRNATIEPLLALLRGDIGPLWRNIVATAGMFSVRGDPLVSYNVPGRPIFMPRWSSVFFYGGLLLALWRWRQPFYVFMLLWLGVMLAPTLLTISAPNHPRMVGALLPIMWLAALPVVPAADWLAARRRAWRRLPIGAALLALLLAGRATWYDYFVVWPTARPDRWEPVYNIALGEIIAAIEHDAATTPAVLNTRSLEDADPTIAAASLQRPAVVLRWADGGRALPLPAGAAAARLFVAEGRWLDGDLSRFAGIGGNASVSFGDYSVLTYTLPVWTVQPEPLLALPVDSPGPQVGETLVTIAPPVVLSTSVQLERLFEFPASVPAGTPITFLTGWRVLAPERGRAAALLVHLTDAGGQLVAQDDGLGYPLHTWRAGDRFVHVQHIATAGLPPGRYSVQIGLYEGASGLRWTTPLPDGRAADRIVLGVVDVVAGE